MGYKMTHPNSGHRIEVDGPSVVTYESQGWETSPHANSPEPPPAYVSDVIEDDEDDES